MEWFKTYKKYFVLGSSVIMLIVFTVLYFNYDNPKEEVIGESSVSLLGEKEEFTSTTSSEFYVDIKGAVQEPGVYLFREGEIVYDAINRAGGLTKNAVTSNINLSKKLHSEMVIYIFNKKELTTKKAVTTTTKSTCECETIEVNNCIKDEQVIENTDSKININTATKEELVTLNGIGDSKAEAIIEYRKKNGNFNSIDDIKNVSGFGDSIFAKIKDSITV